MVMKSASARTLLLFLAIFMGRGISGRVILEGDEHDDFLRDLRSAEDDLCKSTLISVGRPSNLYDQYVQRSVDSSAHNGTGPVRCALQPTLFQLKHTHQIRYFFYPSIVKLHRCGGNCGRVHPDILQCVATETKVITVRVVDTYSGTQCGVRLVDHTNCTCECVTKPGDCNSRIHEYNIDTCSCGCKDHVPCDPGMNWDKDTCACI